MSSKNIFWQVQASFSVQALYDRNIAQHKNKKKGPDKDPAPGLNQISYRKAVIKLHAWYAIDVTGFSKNVT
jgi:hypothetical protein